MVWPAVHDQVSGVKFFCVLYLNVGATRIGVHGTVMAAIDVNRAVKAGELFSNWVAGAQVTAWEIVWYYTFIW